MNVVKLRQWKDLDVEPFVEMNSDPEVTRYLLPMTRDQSLAIFDGIQAELIQRGWGIWAVEVDCEFAGMVGLHEPHWETRFTPCVEVLWRFRKPFWGRGVAYEAASQAIDCGFSKAGLEEIVSFTTPSNHRSIRLMERLGFDRDHQGDFDHPEVPEESDLRRHYLYRKKKPNDGGSFTYTPQSVFL